MAWLRVAGVLLLMTAILCNASATNVATLDYKRGFVAATVENSVRAGEHEVEVWNLISIINDEDSSGREIRNVTIEARAESVVRVFWSEKTLKVNDTYVKWLFDDWVIEENNGRGTGFVSGFEMKYVPISASRSVNKSVFDSSGHQLLTVTLSFEETDFNRIVLWIFPVNSQFVNSEIVSSSISTDAPVKSILSGNNGVTVVFNESEIIPGKNYTVNVTLSISKLSSYPVKVFPGVDVMCYYNYSGRVNLSDSVAELPSYLKPEGIFSVRAESSDVDVWKAQRIDYVGARLQAVSEPAVDLVRIDVYPIDIAYVYEDSFLSGVYELLREYSFGVDNINDAFDKPINGFFATMDSSKPIVFAFGENVNESEHVIEWDMWNRTFSDGSRYCCFGALLPVKSVKYLPFSVERFVNRSEFAENGYQIVNVSFEYVNAECESSYLVIYYWKTPYMNVEILDVDTNLPDAWIGKHSYSVSVGTQCEKIDAGEDYFVKLLVNVSPNGSAVSAKPGVRLYFVSEPSEELLGESENVRVKLEEFGDFRLTASTDFNWILRELPHLGVNLRPEIYLLNDRTPPKIFFAKAPGNGSSVGRLELILKTDEPVVKALVEIDGVNESMIGVSTGWYFSKDLSEGEHRVRVYVQDYAGNWNASDTLVLNVYREAWRLYDTDNDGKISDTELLFAIVRWLNGGISDIDLLGIIIKWLE